MTYVTISHDKCYISTCDIHEFKFIIVHLYSDCICYKALVKICNEYP